MAGAASSWQALRRHGRRCVIMAGTASSWQALPRHGRCCVIMAGAALSWQERHGGGMHVLLIALHVGSCMAVAARTCATLGHTPRAAGDIGGCIW
eukprot:220381-Chlamydomonas_euryale.AAC.1